ncbi:MAG: hypothetical protein JSS75_07135 [Bacteroidetes bacterium]|nr:hypothetical protein [Bacteroidota bacterium]
MTASKIIGYLVTLFALVAPQLNIPFTTSDQAAVSALGIGITGIVTNGFAKSADAVFATITSFIPGIVWLLSVTIHFTLAPVWWLVISGGATIAIALIDKDENTLQWAIAFLDKNFGQKINKTVPILLAVAIGFALAACGGTRKLTKEAVTNEQARVHQYYDGKAQGAPFSSSFYATSDSAFASITGNDAKVLGYFYGSINATRAGDSLDTYSRGFYGHKRDLLDAIISSAKGAY